MEFHSSHWKLYSWTLWSKLHYTLESLHSIPRRFASPLRWCLSHTSQLKLCCYECALDTGWNDRVPVRRSRIRLQLCWSYHCANQSKKILIPIEKCSSCIIKLPPSDDGIEISERHDRRTDDWNGKVELIPIIHDNIFRHVFGEDIRVDGVVRQPVERKKR